MGWKCKTITPQTCGNAGHFKTSKRGRKTTQMTTQNNPTPELTQEEIARLLAMREDTKKEEERWQKRKEELRAKWKGVTAEEMWYGLWQTVEELADMMEICRERYREKQRKSEGEPMSIALFDQTARALEGQFDAIATLARHLFVIPQIPRAKPITPKKLNKLKKEKAGETNADNG